MKEHLKRPRWTNNTPGGTKGGAVMDMDVEHSSFLSFFSSLPLNIGKTKESLGKLVKEQEELCVSVCLLHRHTLCALCGVIIPLFFLFISSYNDILGCCPNRNEEEEPQPQPRQELTLTNRFDVLTRLHCL